VTVQVQIGTRTQLLFDSGYFYTCISVNWHINTIYHRYVTEYDETTGLVDEGRVVDIMRAFSKAFGTVSRKSLIENWLMHGLGEQTVRWIEHWLNSQPTGW